MDNPSTSVLTEIVKTDLKLSALEMRPHQRIALTQLRDGKILWGGVGSGKTLVAVLYYIQEHLDKDVYVITTAKKRDSLDWEREFASHAIGREREYSIGGALTVDSWNNLAKYKDVKNAFFIFDEQRLVGSGAWVRSFLRIAKTNGWILLSATPGDNWMDYIPVFVANGFFKNRTEFIREHVVYKPWAKFPVVERYTGEGKLLKLRNQLLVHMPYQKLTVRHDKKVEVDYSEKLMTSVLKDRWHIYADRPIRSVAELCLVARRIVNSDSSRLKALRAILKRHPKVIIFYNFDYELELLRGLQDVTEVGELNGHNHDPIPEGDSWVYLVQYVAGSEAWNCIDTDAVVFYSLTYSYKMWEQAHGRIDRMNSPFTDLYYYIFKSKSWIDAAIWRKLVRKENFNANKVEIPDV